MDNNRKHPPDEPRNQGAREGSNKNIETSVNNPPYFNDGYELRAEDEIGREESKSKKEHRTNRRGTAGRDRPIVNRTCTIKIA